MQSTHGDGMSISFFVGYLCLCWVTYGITKFSCFNFFHMKCILLGYLWKCNTDSMWFFIWNMWFKIRPCVWHWLHGWGDGEWLRCFPHGWFLMNQGIVCQLFVLFLRFGSHETITTSKFHMKCFCGFLLTWKPLGEGKSISS